MKAVVIDDLPGGLRQPRLALDYADPQAPPGEVQIRTTLAGICNTDLEIVRGYAGFQGVPGHEFVGVVDQAEDKGAHGPAGSGRDQRRLQGVPDVPGRAIDPLSHRTALGIRGRDGTLAEYFCLPAGNLHPVPEGMPDEVAVFAEPLAAACEVLAQVHIRPTDRVVVLGDGKLGLLVAQVLSLTGCDLLVVGRHPEKLRSWQPGAFPQNLRTAPSRLTARHRVYTPGLAGGADMVVECTGRAEGFQAARRLVRRLLGRWC